MKKKYTFEGIDGQHLSVDAYGINDARKKLLETLEWELDKVE
jgi:hypothetical protein